VIREVSMSTGEYGRKLDELDRLLNDPDVPMQPDRIWSLLADVSLPEVTSKTHRLLPQRLITRASHAEQGVTAVQNM
jgi:hypothetical protein